MEKQTYNVHYFQNKLELYIRERQPHLINAIPYINLKSNLALREFRN